MSVAVVLNDEKHATQILPWAAKFAAAQSTDLLAIVVKRSKGTAKWTDIDLAEPEGPIQTAIAAQLDPLSLVPIESKSDTLSSASVEAMPKPELETDAGDQSDSSSPPSLPFSARRFEAAETVTALAEAIASMKIDLLIIPKSVDSRQDADSSDWYDKLYRLAPCQTMFLHDDHVREPEKLKILSVVKSFEMEVVKRLVCLKKEP